MKLNRLIPMLPVRGMPVSVEFYQNMRDSRLNGGTMTGLGDALL
jgi:hypothetical protein